MSGSTRNVPVSGEFLVDSARRNADLFQIAKRLEGIAHDVPDEDMRRKLAEEIVGLLKLVEKSDHAVRGAVKIPE